MIKLVTCSDYPDLMIKHLHLFMLAIFIKRQRKNIIDIFVRGHVAKDSKFDR